jgi:hypothetical protein
MTQEEEAEENVRIELAEALAELRECSARHHVLTTIGMRMAGLEDPTRTARFEETGVLSDRMDELIPVVNLLRVIVNGFDEE